MKILGKDMGTEMKVRIKFAKSGAMRFIGHLDIMRYFQKAIRRADIDVAYSEGFSPHQIMSFAAPLGVGLTSNGEYLDIEIKTHAGAEDMKQRLNKVMVEGMEILAVTMLKEDAKNAMASVAAAEYTVRFRQGYEPGFDWPKRLMEFYHSPSIMVTKKTKKSEMSLDLKPYIYQLSLQETEKAPVIRMLVNASSSGNVKPGLVMEAFLKANGEELSPFALEIIREDTYADTGKEGEPHFVPLDAMGMEF